MHLKHDVYFQYTISIQSIEEHNAMEIFQILYILISLTFTKQLVPRMHYIKGIKSYQLDLGKDGQCIEHKTLTLLSLETPVKPSKGKDERQRERERGKGF